MGHVHAPLAEALALHPVRVGIELAKAPVDLAVARQAFDQLQRHLRRLFTRPI